MQLTFSTEPSALAKVFRGFVDLDVAIGDLSSCMKATEDDDEVVLLAKAVVYGRLMQKDHLDQFVREAKKMVPTDSDEWLEARIRDVIAEAKAKQASSDADD